MDTQEVVKMTPAERLALAREAKKRKAEEIDAKLAKLEELEKRIEGAPENIQGFLPRSWRDAIDKGLGNDFSASIMESSGGNYVIQIVVPEKWDRRTGDEKSMSKNDVTTGLVRRATDISDVTRWCELIKKTIQTKYPEFQVSV